MICWTMGQQAFNAAMILTLSLLHPSWWSPVAAHAARNDYHLVHRAYATFVEMHHKGIHRLAGVACSKLSGLLMQLHPAPPASSGFERPAPPREAMDSVMGNTGMMLLEDPGLQSFVEDAFAPLGFQMIGGSPPTQGMGPGIGIGSPGWAARPVPTTGGGAGAATATTSTTADITFTTTPTPYFNTRTTEVTGDRSSFMQSTSSLPHSHPSGYDDGYLGSRPLGPTFGPDPMTTTPTQTMPTMQTVTDDSP